MSFLNTLPSPTLTPTPDPISIAPAVEERVATLTPEPVLLAKAPETTPLPRAEGPLLDVNGLARSSVVNILCAGTTLRGASGSGIMIDPRGVILTNAHMAQFFLLKDYPRADATKCVVRTGSPAEYTYYASLLYLPEVWIDANAEQITSKTAMGTGEHDYAFLLIDKAYGGKDLPPTYPSISYTIEEPHAGDPMLLAAYPSQDLSNKTIVNNLLVSSTFTIVKKIYTFHERTVDLFSIGSTTISQGGASGGAAVRASDGKVMGIITIATQAKDVLDRDLRAISLAHVNRSLAAEGKAGISALLSGNLSDKVTEFGPLANKLRKKLIEVIEK